MTEHFNAEQVAGAFFATYAEALLRRDADAIAEHYATPALIEFPQAASPVSERAQTPFVVCAGLAAGVLVLFGLIRSTLKRTAYPAYWW